MKTRLNPANSGVLQRWRTSKNRWQIAQMLPALGISLLLHSCASPGKLEPGAAAVDAKLRTAYDYALVDANSQAISLAAMAESLRSSDVIFIGEYHSNHASHLFEMQLFATLHQLTRATQRPIVLSMEMFNRDQQKILNDYLAGKIGERYLIEEAPTWKNYRAAYRPLIEYAKQHAIAVVAANAASDIVRCIGRRGADYIDQLEPDKRQAVAEQAFADIPGYKDKFMGVMAGANHTANERLQRSYLAQLSRDNTMAESIARAYTETPNSIIVHLSGTFHSEQSLGTVGALKRLQPTLKMSVISPIHHTQTKTEPAHSEPRDAPSISADATEKKDDFYYIIRPQPEEFVDEDYMHKIHQKMFSNANKQADSCEKT